MPEPLFDCRIPVVAAPMAGGPTTAALALAVTRAGGFAFLAGGYKPPEALAAEMAEIRRGGRPFGVNVFVPSTTSVDLQEFRRYAMSLEEEAARYGVTINPCPVQDDDHWPQTLALLLRDPVPVVSLTFGLPDESDIAALRAAGSRVVATVTTASEALVAQAAAVDGLIVQGYEAGGHSAIHDPAGVVEPIRTEDLVQAVRAVTDLPIVAAGGVDGPDAVHRLLTAGAEAVAVGTMFLLADEAGTSLTHRAALTDDALTQTVITRAFTGRPARALRNGFVDRHSAAAPVAYPAIHYLTRELRQAAGKAGDRDMLHLWAGTGWRHAPAAPAADIVRWLAGEPRDHISSPH